MNYFQYGEKEIEYLKKKDKKLSRVIDEIGHIKRGINTDPFSAIIESIIGQQISTKAAVTVNARFKTNVGEITPENIKNKSLREIQRCGMSLRKAGYIKGVADAALSGQVDFNSLHLLSDEEIIRKLSSLSGVGVWTAEMILIFSLNRMDVISFNDLAIRRGMMKLYGHKELPKDRFAKYKKRYSPYASVASLYLWVISV